MLKETREEKEIRIFNHYKSRLKKLDSEKIRFSTIEYLCYFPKIDPVNYPLSKANGLPASQTSQPTISTGVNSGSPYPILLFLCYLS